MVSVAWFFVFSACADSEYQSPPIASLQNTPAGTVFQIGDHVQLFKNMQPNELLGILITIPVGGLIATLAMNSPTYLLFVLSPLIHKHPARASQANNVADQIRFLIRYLAIMYTLRSAYDLVYGMVQETMTSSSQNIEQWYQWANCDHRVGSYPVFIMASELASLFHLQVSITEEGIAQLDITLIGSPNIKSPLPWEKLASAMKSREIPFLSIQIGENNNGTKLKLNTDSEQERIITLIDSHHPWDINLMAQWCSQTHSEFHSVFHPGFILAVAHILTHQTITDLISQDPIQVSDQSLLQTGSASLYTFAEGDNQQQIIWSDQPADYGGPGYIVWSMNQQLDESDLNVASQGIGSELFRQCSAQQQWSREMVMLLEVIASSLFSARIEQKHHKMLVGVSQKLLTLPLPAQPAPATSLTLPSSKKLPDITTTVSESRTRNLLRGLFRPLHTAMMSGSRKTLSHWINPSQLVKKLFPVNLFRPMFMVDPDEFEDSPFPSSDKTSAEQKPPEKQSLRQSHSEIAFARQKNSWDKKRAASSHSLPGRDGSLKYQKGSRKWPHRKGSARSMGSTVSSKSSGSQSKQGDLSRHSSSGRLMSTDSDSDIAIETIRFLELMGFEEEGFSDLSHWLSHGFSDDIPAPPLLIELTEITQSFLQQAMSEVSSSVARLPGLVVKTSTTSLDAQQPRTRIEELSLELSKLENQFQKLMTLPKMLPQTESELEIDSVPVHKFWLQHFRELHLLGIELTSPPIKAFPQSFPALPSPLNPDNKEALIEAITQFQVLLKDLKMVIKQSLSNPVLIEGIWVDPVWFDICTEFESNSELLLLDTKSLDSSGEFYHVDFERILQRVKSMQDQLYSVQQLPSGRSGLVNPQTRQAIFSAPASPDNNLLRSLLLSEEPINWVDVNLSQLDLLNQQLSEDAQHMKEQLIRVESLLEQAPALPPFFHQYIHNLILGQKLGTLEDILQKATETQLWLDHQHQTIHTKIVTLKELEKGQGDIDVKVDIYEPVLTRLAYLNHRLIVACGDWRTGCPPMGSILAITLTNEMESAAGKARLHLEQLEKISRQLQDQGVLQVLGPLYSKLDSSGKLLSIFLKQSQQFTGEIAGQTLVGSTDHRVTSIVALLDSQAAMEQQLQELKITELNVEEAVQMIQLNALEFSQVLFPMKQQLLGTNVTPEVFTSFQVTQVMAMIDELKRLVQVALHLPQKIPSLDQRELLKWNTELLDAMKEHVQSGNLMSPQFPYKGLGNYPFLAQTREYREQTVLELVMGHYQELATEFPWMGADPDKIKPASTRKTSENIEQSILELQPGINQAASAMAMEVQLWEMLHTSIHSPSCAMSRVMETIWRFSSEAPTAILPDEQHQLPFSEEIQLLWQQNDAATREATVDISSPSDIPPPAIAGQNTVTPGETESSHHFAVQVYQPESVDPGAQYQAHLQKTRQRHAAHININGLVQSWKIQVNTPISFANEQMGAHPGDPETAPPLPTALIPVSSKAESQHKSVQCNTPAACLEQRYQLFHFNRAFPVKLSSTMRERCTTLLQQLKTFQSSLSLLDKSKVKDIRKILSNTEQLQDELQACWSTPLPTLESFLPRAPVEPGAQQP